MKSSKPYPSKTNIKGSKSAETLDDQDDEFPGNSLLACSLSYCMPMKTSTPYRSKTSKATAASPNTTSNTSTSTDAPYDHDDDDAHDVEVGIDAFFETAEWPVPSDPVPEVQRSRQDADGAYLAEFKPFPVSSVPLDAPERREQGTGLAEFRGSFNSTSTKDSESQKSSISAVLPPPYLTQPRTVRGGETSDKIFKSETGDASKAPVPSDPVPEITQSREHADGAFLAKAQPKLSSSVPVNAPPRRAGATNRGALHRKTPSNSGEDYSRPGAYRESVDTPSSEAPARRQGRSNIDEFLGKSAGETPSATAPSTSVPLDGQARRDWRSNIDESQGNVSSSAAKDAESEDQESEARVTQHHVQPGAFSVDKTSERTVTADASPAPMPSDPVPGITQSREDLDGYLVEAKLVSERALVYGEPVEEEGLRSKMRRRGISLLLIVMLVAISVVLGVLLGGGSNSAPAIIGFENTKDLRSAVALYLVDNTTGSVVASTYGWPIGVWDVSEIEDFSFLFANENSDGSASFNPAAASFDESISEWDVSSATDMAFMFHGAKSFNQPLVWNVSSVTSMQSMFESAESFNQPLEKWDVSSATNMRKMFAVAMSFNHPLDWDVSSVLDLGDMFKQATSFNQPLAGWNLSSVLDVSGMFFGATSFNQPLADWNVSSVVDMSFMFFDATSFNQPIGNWDVASVKEMFATFFNATSFDQPLGSWDLSSVTNQDRIFIESGCPVADGVKSCF
jgi:surface protein